MSTPETPTSGCRPGEVIMVIRHGEKPAGGYRGVTEEGVPSKKSLTIAGWIRAGALMELFAAAGDQSRPGLFRPHTLFASNRDGPGGGSEGEQETLRPLARRLGLALNTDHGVGEESALAAAAQAAEGPVLICWKHDYVGAIVDCLGRVDPAPRGWPEDRYDVIWVFARQEFGYRFHEIPQLLLGDDRPVRIS